MAVRGGASADITKVNNDGCTSMYAACYNGHLSVCQWLFDVGASADITRASNDSFTPMYAACFKGHLSVCQWLFEVGASADITRAGNDGTTRCTLLAKKVICRCASGCSRARPQTSPGGTLHLMYIACYKGHLSVCHGCSRWARR